MHFKRLHPKFGIWNLEFGIWNLELPYAEPMGTFSLLDEVFPSIKKGKQRNFRDLEKVWIVGIEIWNVHTTHQNDL
jgi:hypothetical protein